MNEVYFIIFPILSCIPFALFYFYERIIARNRVKNAAFLFMGVILGGLTVFGLQLPVLVNNPTFNRFINQFLEILGSDSGQQISSQNTTPTPSVPQTNINTTSDDEEEERKPTFRGGSSQKSSNDDSPDAISGKYKDLDDAFADLEAM